MNSMTTSELKCFRSCRKRYEFEYVRMLIPVETPKALSIGRQYHKGVELILNGYSYEEVENLLFNEEMENANKYQIEPNLFDTYLALEMVRHFAEYSNWQSWKIKAIEQNFEVPTGYGKRLKGRIDGLIDVNGFNYLIEHKSASQLNERYVARLTYLDEQNVNYIYAYNKLRELGQIEDRPIGGIFYNIIEKPLLKPLKATELKYKKDGTLYASCRLEDETPEEYRLRVRQWYSEGNRMIQKYISRTAEEIERAVVEFNATVRDLNQAKKNNTWYRNSNACSILPCPYECKCICDDETTDEYFTVKTQKNEELI